MTPIKSEEWSRLILDTSRLWADASMVLGLRFLRIMAGGPAARREIKLMVSEKTAAAFELADELIGGEVKSPATAARKALTVYGARVRANRRRLG